MSGFRLAEGGRIDRGRRLRFHFDGRSYYGFQGDTLASALLASGVRIFGRSFKFHRPRGLLSAGVEEPNALVELGEAARAEPSARATMVQLYEGLVARAQNAWPHRLFDLGRVLDATHPLWPAGFYHKTFIWPTWGLYEGLVRRMAGLGRPLQSPDPDRYDHRNLHCDVLVVGSGPAGLAAALAAGRSGARVLLIEQDAEFGGSLLWERIAIEGQPGTDWLAATLAELDGCPEVRRLARTTAFGYYDHNVVGLHERATTAPEGRQPRERYWRVRAGQIILATGAIEQPLVFAYNDRPGIMLAGAVRHYLNRYAVAAGERLVVATNNDSAYRTALDLAAAGVTVQAIVDSRDLIEGELPRRARAEGITVHEASIVTHTHGGRGLKAVSIGRLGAAREYRGRIATIECDVLAMSGGWLPALHLYSQARGTLRFEEAIGGFVPEGFQPSLQVVGSAAGDYGLKSAFRAGGLAGQRAAESAGFESAQMPEPPSVDQAQLTHVPNSPRRSPVGPAARQWIDFQYDVTVADIELAVRENYTSVEHLKRYTSAGMSIDQGKTSNLAALELLAELTGRPITKLVPTTFRPAFMPVTLGALAGRNLGERYSPAREMPAHDWHRTHGAVFEEVGGWHRPTCYPRSGETPGEAIRREALNVRHGVGLFEGSPLGKIELRGPDTLEFLDHFYINDLRTLQTGRLRYGIMLNENGTIIDDGTVARLDDEHYLITTTSGHADRIGAWLEEWRQCEWPAMRVMVSPVTAQWATLTLSGPRARDVLGRLESDIDLGRDTFPHMSVRSGRLEGLPVRLYRVSFSGELGYELNVPAGYGLALWERLMEIGSVFEISPFGLETMLILRMEKGYLHVGIDTDGTTTPDDVGWGSVADAKRADFIGKRSLSRPANRRSDRRQLVGLTSSEPAVLVAGAHLRLEGTTRGSDGWVTSACISPCLGQPIALALVHAGRSRLGERLSVHDEDRRGVASVVEPRFYDPAGHRLRG